MKEKYMEPKETNLTETTDVRDILQLARDLCQSSTEEICDIFSMGINPELKKRFDYADLYSIGTDINRYETFSYFNPNLYIYEKQRHTKAMGLTDEESDKLRPYPSEPRFNFLHISKNNNHIIRRIQLQQ